MDKIHGENRRKYLRYRPDHLQADSLEKRALEITGFVDFAVDGAFQPGVSGLLADKSHAGCALTVNTSPTQERLQPGVECRLKAGPLEPMRAVVRWRRVWDEGLVKIGFQFLE